MNFKGANLYWVDLEGANLEGADREGAYLKGADLTGANFEGASLEGAYLKGANLNCVNFEGANLEGANIEGANLESTYFFDADLKNVGFKDANFRWASLDGAKNIPNIPLACPSEGAFIGWKKVEEKYLVKIQIPEDARRLSATTRKCRCDKAVVLTTEKDAVRLRDAGIVPDNMRPRMWYLPIEVEFSQDKTNTFDSRVLRYVCEHRRNTK